MDMELIDGKIINYPLKCQADPRGLGVLFMERMQKYKNNIGQIDANTGQTMTHGEILLRSIRVAQHLQERQITTDDVIAICAYNTMDTSLPVFASLFLGVKISPLDPSLPKSDFIYLLNLVKPKIIFSGIECVDIIEEVIKEENLDTKIVVFGETKKHIPFSEFLISTGTEYLFQAKPAKSVFDTPLILFSSGTTGFPKGVNCTHYALQVNQEVLRDAFDPSVVIFFSTYYWISAILLTIITVLEGTTRLVVQRFDETKFMDNIEKYNVSFIFMVSLYSYKLTKLHEGKVFNFNKLKSIILSGVKISEDQMKEMKKLLPRTKISSGYGLTEINGFLTIFNIIKDADIVDKKPNSCGKPLSGFMYKIVDINTKEILGANQEGEIRIKSKNIFGGYLNNPEATRNAFDNDGYFCTGDIGYYDEDYCFHIIDRIKELIKYQSWHVVPAELEYILLSHPDVKEAVAFAIPNYIDGDHPAACITMKENATSSLEDIMKFYNDKIDNFHRQKLRGGLYIVESIFRTPSGKISRKKIRDYILEGKSNKVLKSC